MSDIISRDWCAQRRCEVAEEQFAEIERLRAALQFYAGWESSKMFWDEGETARRALEGKE